MILELPIADLKKLVATQIRNLFGLNEQEKFIIYSSYFDDALARSEYSFNLNPNKYYQKLTIGGGKMAYFNPFQSAQYTIFLYYLSNCLSEPESRLADKVYYLNKMLNGCDLYHQVELPKFFRLDHPVGSVMGRAVYGEGFMFAQNCTVGNNKGIYPIIGENVRMCAYSSILGNCKIGNNVILGAHAAVKDTDIPDNSIVFGQSPNLILKKQKSKENSC